MWLKKKNFQRVKFMRRVFLFTVVCQVSSIHLHRLKDAEQYSMEDQTSCATTPIPNNIFASDHSQLMESKHLIGNFIQFLKNENIIDLS